MCSAPFRHGGVAALQLFDGELELRVVLPLFARRARHRCTDQPGLQALKLRVDRHQLVQRRGAGARNAGDDDGGSDGVAVEAGCLLHLPECVSPRIERLVYLAPGDAPPLFGQVRIVVQRQQQHVEPRAVVTRTEIIGTEFARDQLVKFVAGIGEPLRWCETIFHSGDTSH